MKSSSHLEICKQDEDSLILSDDCVVWQIFAYVSEECTGSNSESKNDPSKQAAKRLFLYSWNSYVLPKRP